MKKKTKIITIVSSAVALVLAFAIVFVTVIIPLNKYNNGLELIENGKFDDAIVVFKELGDYKDSQTQIKEAKYQKAISLRKKNNFDGAIEIFGKLGKYKDSQTQITETNYMHAMQLKENQKYNLAIKLFKSIGKYKDSKTQIKDIKHKKALKLIEKKKYENAYFLLHSIKDYEPASKLLGFFKRVPTVKYANGKPNYLTYDSQGKLISESNNFENIVKYDSTNSTGYTLQDYPWPANYSYDSKGNLIKKYMTTGPDEHYVFITKYYYDKNNVCTSEEYATISISSTITHQYDENGRLIKSFETGSARGEGFTSNTTFTYDKNGNLITKTYYHSWTNGWGDTYTRTDYTYDNNNRLIQESYNDDNTKGTTTITYTYDKYGCVSSEYRNYSGYAVDIVSDGFVIFYLAEIK